MGIAAANGDTLDELDGLARARAVRYKKLAEAQKSRLPLRSWRQNEGDARGSATALAPPPWAQQPATARQCSPNSLSLVHSLASLAPEPGLFCSPFPLPFRPPARHSVISCAMLPTPRSPTLNAFSTTPASLFARFSYAVCE